MKQQKYHTPGDPKGVGGVVGPDQKMVTERPYNWSPGLILGAFCIIFRARPVGTGLGAKFGRKPAKNQIKIISLSAYNYNFECQGPSYTCRKGLLSKGV